MKLSVVSLFALLAGAQAFQAQPVSFATKKHALTLSATSPEAAPFVQGERVIREQLPTLYVYDHCPFCVRVRVALGMKNVKHLVNFLANDDIPTPTALVGKKIAPIFVSIY